MRRNKTLFGTALVVLIMMMGICYAAITGIDLGITGSASTATSDENFKVKFMGTISKDTTGVSANSSAVVVNAAITDDHNATLTISGLTTKDDVVTATYTIKNESPELKASITAGNISNDNTEYFKVTSSVGSSSIVAGDTTTLTVTVELVKTPIGQVSASITVPFKATAQVSD